MTGGDARDGWDFFLSYTQADKAWAEWVAWVLEEDGYRVLIQAWDFVPGTNWILGMQAGIDKSTRTIAILSDDYLASVYGSAEWQATWALDPAGAWRSLLVVRVADCPRRGLLAAVVGVDLFGLDDVAASAQLRAMIKAALSGRAKPSVKPKFPGTKRVVPREPQFPGPEAGQAPYPRDRKPNKAVDEAASFGKNRKGVLVIYGRDREANDALRDWLRAIGLQPLEWTHLISGSGAASPYIGAVLEKAFEQVQAVVVFFTPDEWVVAASSLRTTTRGGRRHAPTYSSKPAWLWLPIPIAPSCSCLAPRSCPVISPGAITSASAVAVQSRCTTSPNDSA
jgi:hypothetical protein